MKVMLIDDFIMTLEAHETLLKDKGYNVILAFYSHNDSEIDEKILEHYKKENPDLCILDGLEGKALDLAENLKKNGAKRIIVYSGREDLVERAKELGFESYNKFERKFYNII